MNRVLLINVLILFEPIAQNDYLCTNIMVIDKRFAL